MLAVYSCIVNDHDLSLVVLAAFICALASFTAITLLHHVSKATSHMRHIWLGVAAVVTGFGVWATHFIAMLAFTPGLPSGYDIALTAASLVAAIILTGGGFAVCFATTAPARHWLGGMVVGGGIAVMHYTGMAAFEVEGRLMWDMPLVIASVVLGALLGGVALRMGMSSDTFKQRSYGATLLTAAICSHHFTAM